MGAIELITRKLLRSNEGGSAIEFALAAPVLILAIMGILDGALFFWTSSALHNGAVAAARCAAIGRSDCLTQTQITQAASNASYGLSPSPSVFSVGTATCGTKVSAAWSYTSSFGSFSPFNRTINVSACY